MIQSVVVPARTHTAVMPSAYFNSGVINRGAARKLLFFYFLATFSYAHLPLANIHHSLGSLFNYVFFLISIFVLVIAIRAKIFYRRECVFLFFSVFLLTLIFGLQVIFIYPGVSDGNSFLTRSLGSIASTLASYLGIFLAVCLAKYCNFTFRHMSAACFYSLAILCGYLFIETLGVQFNLEPFGTVVVFFSKYLNYRDEVDSLGGRVRGFSNEPSYMAVVVVFLTTILLIDNTRSKKTNYIFLVVVLVLSAASLSKNLLGGVMVLLVLHAFYYRKIFPIIFLLIALSIAYFVYATTQVDGIQWQYEAYGYDISTITRVGSWVAAWDGFVDSPFIGNGYGLAGGILHKFYPEWFYVSPEAADWEAASVLFATPVFSNIFRVMFESGVLGLIFIFGSIYFLVKGSNRRKILSHDNVMLVCAFLLCFGMVDVMSYWPFYVALGIRRSLFEVR
jgi:hypothetical protein